MSYSEEDYLEEHELSIVPTVEEDYADLPPSFIQESDGPSGEKVFKITTPTGKKFENLSEDMAIKVVMELENQKKAS